MELLKELWTGYKLFGHEEQEESPEEDNLLDDEENPDDQGFGDEFGDEFDAEQDPNQEEGDDLLDDEGEDDLMGGEDDMEEDPKDDQELDQVANKATENPDRQGLIRAVRGAHMVYKRQTEEGTYEELWVYNSADSVAKNLEIRKAILSGTDIPPNKTNSPDGKQQYTLWTAGNAELLNIKGLPN